MTLRDQQSQTEPLYRYSKDIPAGRQKGSASEPFHRGFAQRDHKEDNASEVHSSRMEETGFPDNR